ncbi:MAG: hypothetical protein Q7R80_05000 [bacterium]|nr:hypothetical protein [bacterium]
MTAERGSDKLLDEEVSMGEREYNEQIARENEEAWERLRDARNNMTLGRMDPDEVERLERRAAAHVHSVNLGRGR